jgi:ATP synthase F1 delta subunit
MKVDRQEARDAARLFRLSLVDGKPDIGLVRQIVSELLASGRRSRFAIVDSFMRLLKRDFAARMAEVDSAAPLDDDTRAAIEAGLARRFKRAIAITFCVNPALIGGVRITAASEVYDDSVRGRLAALEMPA